MEHYTSAQVSEFLASNGVSGYRFPLEKGLIVVVDAEGDFNRLAESAGATLLGNNMSFMYGNWEVMFEPQQRSSKKGYIKGYIVKDGQITLF